MAALCSYGWLHEKRGSKSRRVRSKTEKKGHKAVYDNRSVCRWHNIVGKK